MTDLQDLLAELSSGNDAHAEAAIPALTEMGMKAMHALVELTHSRSADLRWWGVRALAASPHTRTEDLLPLLGDASPEVRAAAALALCENPHDSAVPALVALLADENSLVASLAANALVRIGSSSVGPLLEAMSEAQTGLRILALRALAEIRDPRSIPVMMKCLSEESALLQYWAQTGLERLGLDMVYIKP